MNIFKSNRRWIAWTLIVCFLYLVEITSMPLTADTTEVEDQSGSPTAIEKISSPRPTVEKSSILPWILIGLGVVAVGVAVYFLVIKKPKYTLTVTMGEGASGTPAAGTYEYKKGETVNYDFTPSSGYIEVTVKLDSVAASESGTITMDKDHTLEVNAKEGLQEDFTTSADSLWQPESNGTWSVTDGYYRCVSSAPQATGTFYNKAWSQANYTVTVRMRRVTAGGWYENYVLLGTTPSFVSFSGYIFSFFYKSGSTCIWKGTNFNHLISLGTWSYIKPYTLNPDIVTGLNQWNVLKIVKSGSNYTFYTNDVVFHTFSDSTFDPRYVGLGYGPHGVSAELNVDYVYVDVGNTAASRPGAPAILLTARQSHRGRV